jgi:hypothetical protein
MVREEGQLTAQSSAIEAREDVSAVPDLRFQLRVPDIEGEIRQVRPIGKELLDGRRAEGPGDACPEGHPQAKIRERRERARG